jgi:hypothetical protein
MLTIQIKGDFIFQVHKNHVSSPLLGDEMLVFTENIRQSQITISTYGFKELQNCYLITIDSKLLSKSDTDNTLEIIDANNSVVYGSKVILVFPN